MTVTHGGSVAGGQGQHPSPTRVAQDWWVCCNALRSQRASLWVCVHLFKHGDAHTWHQFHHHTSFTWQHRIPACWQTASPLTTLTAIVALQKAIINRHRMSLLLRVCSFEDHWSTKRNQNLSWAADSCVPDVYVSSSRLTNEQTAISLNWD